MKLLRRSSTETAAKVEEKDGSQTVSTASSNPKQQPKRKKFGLFQKRKTGGDSTKRKSGNKTKTPSSPRSQAKDATVTTPDTVAEFDDENKSEQEQPIPTSKKPATEKTQEELQETLSWARNLLQELDLVAADVSPDGTEQGTELILPGTEYNQGEANKEDKCDKNNDDKIDDEEGNEISQIEEGIPLRTSEGDADKEQSVVIMDTVQPEEGGEEKKEEQTNPGSDSCEVEKEEVDNDNTHCTEEKQQEEEKPSIQQEESKSKATLDSSMKLLSSVFRCTTEDVGNYARLPETIVRILPTGWESPFQHQRNPTTYGSQKDDTLDDKAGSEFLNDMLNIGYTLIYYKPVDDDEDWIGRTVNLNFRPGVCTDKKIFQPAIEWSTMVGGKTNVVDTTSMNLLNIDAISCSKNTQGTALDSGHDSDDSDDFDCFFTITSQEGEVYLFETLNIADSNRIVSGIKYSASRLSNLLIEGNTKSLLAEFYDNTHETEDSRLSETQVINRLSHALLDGL